MKKQILFLAMFTMAIIFAGTTNVFGQLLPGITTTQPIDPLGCVAGSLPLHPYPGQSYTYTMTGDPAADEQPDQWTWFATKDNSFISTVAGVSTLNTANMLTVTPGELLGAGASYGVSSGTNSVDITWSPEILANTVYQGVAGEPTFVVGYATGVACADNIQVYEINPIFNFQIDIANIDPATDATMAWDATTSQCVDVVRSSVYDNTTHEITMDYGTNTLYFEVAAANFVDDFTPYFTLNSGLVGNQTAVVTLHSSLADAQADANVLGSDNWTSATTGWATGLQFTASTPADAVEGVSLFVKVVISNLDEESLTDNVFSLAVDARDQTNTGIWDMEDDDCPSGGGVDAQDMIDVAEHTVSARPTINMDGGAMSEPSGTPAEDVIPKN